MLYLLKCLIPIIFSGMYLRQQKSSPVMCAGPASELYSSQGTQSSVFSSSSSPSPFRPVERCASDSLLFSVFSSSSSPSPFRPVEWCASDSLQSSVRPHLLLPSVQWSGVHLTVFSLQFVLISFSLSSSGVVCI